ncbi:hypothetical protein E1293_15025 [Actinomadura darangshiensis]|uniref:Uncharacterized protein n=1 Tax=Actinomadura darangshiensis TaxID=705336 RepID=A0A4R5BD88_9ACTN|nr:hypothetical protein E1293_15025 [Actinomadura darangshiensis]
MSAAVIHSLHRVSDRPPAPTLQSTGSARRQQTVNRNCAVVTLCGWPRPSARPRLVPCRNTRTCSGATGRSCRRGWRSTTRTPSRSSAPRATA